MSDLHPSIDGLQASDLLGPIASDFFLNLGGGLPANWECLRISEQKLPMDGNELEQTSATEQKPVSPKNGESESKDGN